MKIYQVLVTIAYGDGVGNDVMALYNLIKNAGYITEIYAENIDEKLSCVDLHHIHDLPDFQDEDVVFYHLSTGTALNDRFIEWNGRKIIIYHNITPPKWFEGYDNIAMNLCMDGLKQAKKLATHAEYCIADSEFNKKDLREMGYICPIDVLPIIVPFQDYDKEPDWSLVDKYKDGYTNILFTGRMAPNKCQQDVVHSFATYQKKYNSKSRLFIIGAYSEENRYYQLVKQCVEDSGAENVIFTGHIPFSQILAYFRMADMFLCMSEHEGFCIPLLEAMYFNIPIVAYSSTAVPETLGGTGILVEEKDFDNIAHNMHRVLTDNDYCRSIVRRQSERVNDFKYCNTEKKFLEFLNNFLKNGEKR